MSLILPKRLYGITPISETLNAEPVYSVEHLSRSLILISEDSPGVLCPSRPYSRLGSLKQSLGLSQWTAIQ